MTTMRPYLSISADNIGSQIRREENHSRLNTTSHLPEHIYRTCPGILQNFFSSPFLILLLLYIITLAHSLDLHYKTMQPLRLTGVSRERQSSLGNSGRVVSCFPGIYIQVIAGKAFKNIAEIDNLKITRASSRYVERLTGGLYCSESSLI